MSNQIPMTNDKMTKNKYDLEERTAKFSEEIIKFAKKILENSITKPLISQLVRSGLVSGQIITKPMMPNLKKIFNIKLESLKKKREKRCIG
jgi:hypothetical protein